MRTRFYHRLSPAGGVIVALGTLLSGGILSSRADQMSVDPPLSILSTETNVAVFWQLPAECATNLVLTTAPDPSGNWSLITGAAQPFVPADPTGSQVFRTEFILPVGCSNASQIAQLVRSFYASSHTNLNPAAEFEIRIEPVRDLWEALGIQIMKARLVVGGQEASRFGCVLYGGTVTELGRSFGGYGLMSGLVKGQSFYFTYSFGSGLQRSQVGKLQIVEGAVKLWATDDFFERDLFLRRTDSAIAIESGLFQVFNGWTEPGDFGWIDESDPAATKVIGLDGSVLSVFLPVSP